MDQVNVCGTVSGKEVDKFKESNIIPVAGQKVDAPLIDECVGHIECRVVNQYNIGDHILFVGKVVAASARIEGFICRLMLERGR